MSTIESKVGVASKVTLQPLITSGLGIIITPNKPWKYNVLSRQGAIHLANCCHYIQIRSILDNDSKINNKEVVKSIFDYCYETKFTSTCSGNIKFLLLLFIKSDQLSNLLNKKDEMYKKLFEMWTLLNKDCKLKVLEMSHPEGKCIDKDCKSDALDSSGISTVEVLKDIHLGDTCIFCKLQCDFEIAKANQYITNIREIKIAQLAENLDFNQE